MRRRICISSVISRAYRSIVMNINKLSILYKCIALKPNQLFKENFELIATFSNGSLLNVCSFWKALVQFDIEITSFCCWKSASTVVPKRALISSLVLENLVTTAEAPKAYKLILHYHNGVLSWMNQRSISYRLPYNVSNLSYKLWGR